jgi:hypothetical protein
MKKILVLASLALLMQQQAAAGTGYYLVTTYPNEGQRTIDFKYWNAKPTGKPPRSSPEIGFGYNVSSRWFTEITAQWFQLSPGSNHLAAIEWQNDFMSPRASIRSTSPSIPMSNARRTARAKSVSNSGRCCRPSLAARSST